MTSEILTITRVRPKGPYILDITFNDGSRKHVNVEPLLWGPVFEPVLDPEEFRRVYVDDVMETVAWPSGADLAPETLYQLPETELAD